MGTALIRKFALTGLLFGATVANAASTREVWLTPGREPQQEFRGFGFTAAPIDWDGFSMLRNEEGLVRLYRRIRPQLGRIIVGGTNIYRTENSTVRDATVVQIIEPQVRALLRVGVERYLLSLASPPPALKRIRALPGIVEGEPNGVAEAEEERLARFVAELALKISQRGLPPPTWVSFQMQPDVIGPAHGYPPGNAESALYSPEQWVRVAGKVQAALAKEKLSVAVLGPEAATFAWTARVLECADRAGWNWTGGVSLSGTGARDGVAYVHREIGGWLQRQYDAQHAIWAIAPDLTKVADDRELLLGGMHALIRDLTVLRASYWIWRYGFTWERNAEGLVCGRELEAGPLYLPLRALTEVVRPGMRVVPVAVDPASRIEAVAFRSADTTVILAVNRGAVAVNLHHVDPDAAAQQAVTFTAAATAETPRRVGTVCGEVTVPPDSVTLLTVSRRYVERIDR